MTLATQRHRFTVKQWHQMIEARVFHPDDRLELIEGEVIVMAPIGSPHQSTVDRLTHLLVTRLGDRAIVRVQGPIVLAAEDSEPQPDLALLQPRADFYRSGHPEPGDILLAIEVTDTTTELDRRVKLPLYARAGIPETWLVDLNQEAVEIYRQPGPGGYQSAWTASRGEALSPGAFPDLTLGTGDILG
jgi:Uma2 family endonuclease